MKVIKIIVGLIGLFLVPSVLNVALKATQKAFKDDFIITPLFSGAFSPVDIINSSYMGSLTYCALIIVLFGWFYGTYLPKLFKRS